MTTGRPTTWATNGVVCSPHYLASQAGLRVLQAGGNAVDAAIATNATLNAVYPHQCHVGGDLFAMVYDPRDGSLSGLNASGYAASGQTVEFMHERGHSVMPERGPLAVTVPGVVGGWAALHERFGSKELGELLASAVGYARDGSPMSAKFARYLEMIRPQLSEYEGARNTFLSQKAGVGEPLRQPGLATTLERIGREGRDALYTGSVAEEIVATLNAGGSPMTLEDLANYQPEWVTPISTNYRGYDLYELPPNTQGATALLMANIVEGWPVAAFGHTTGAGVHAWVETKLRAFAERDAYIADQRFAPFPAERFLDKQAAARHREAIDLERTAGARTPNNDGDTVYLCCVDRDGMAVSLIQSVYLGFGSFVMAEKSGVLLHNRGRGFVLEEGHPNAIAPGKRPYHTLIPAMLLRDGRPEIVFGTMGADAQAQVQLQLLLGFVDFELEPQTAIETPRWVSGAGPDGAPWLRVEPRMGEATLADLRRRGHNVVVGEEWDSAMGHAHCIRIDRERGALGGGSDPRSDGLAAGW
jgi:gamma-glutamyltranspeptidase / glutathione hydrolase